MEWIKLKTNLFKDEKIKIILAEKNGSEKALIWVKLLCLAGEQESLGVFKISGNPMTSELLAVVTDTPKALMEQAISSFLTYGMLAKDGDFYVIPNWEKHQSVDKQEAKREAGAKRVAEFRKRQKKEICNADVTHDVTLCNADVTHDVTLCNATEKEKEIDIDKDYIITPPIIPPTDKSADGDRASVERSFQGFWDAYPRKEGEEDARKAWRKLKPSPELVEEIMEGLSTWKATEAWEREEGRYIPTAVKFITGKRWKDYPQEFRSEMEWERRQTAFLAKGAMA